LERKEKKQPFAARLSSTLLMFAF